MKSVDDFDSGETKGQTGWRRYPNSEEGIYEKSIERPVTAEHRAARG
jgi:hypothetical protein